MRVFKRTEGTNIEPDRQNDWKNPSHWFLPITFFSSGCLIILAAHGDLWLDEIWSIGYAEQATGSWDIVSRFTIDNNHVLNTEYLFLLGQQDCLVLYRLFSIICGIASLLLVGYACRSWPYFARLSVFLLASFSFPLILYFSEARGYAPAIFFALLAYLALDRHRGRPSWSSLLTFWSAMILGILAHATFLMVALALFCMAAADATSARFSQRRLAVLGAMFGLPAMFYCGFYFLFLRNLQIGGGDQSSYLDVIQKIAVLVIGLPDRPWSGLAALACIFGTLGSCLFLLKFNPESLFYLSVLLLGPAALLLIEQPEYLYPRYFIVCIPFAYLMLGRVLGILHQSKLRWMRLSAPAVLALILAGQIPRIASLLNYGRGQYTAALWYIAGHTPTEQLRIGSDHDFRNRMVLDFYARHLKLGKPLHYIGQEHWSEDTPDWVILHSQDTHYRPPGHVDFTGRRNFDLVAEYPFSGYSGWSWFLYRRSDWK